MNEEFKRAAEDAIRSIQESYTPEYARRQIPLLLQRVNDVNTRPDDKGLAHADLVKYHLVLQQEQEARFHSQQAEQFGWGHQSWYWYARGSEMNGMTEEAIVGYRNILRFDSAWGLWLLGEFYERKGNTSMAFELYRVAGLSKGTNYFKKESLKKVISRN